MTSSSTSDEIQKEREESDYEDDSMIDFFLENIDFLEDYSVSDPKPFSTSSETSPFPTSPSDRHHVVYVKKRKYERKKEVQQKDFKYQSIITFPRILKSDIRRKYVFMYENVINSYDYQLIYSFFHQFMKEDIPFERRILTQSGISVTTMLIVAGVKLLTEYFLLLLQTTPDKVTRVSDIQIKQTSNDMERSEISCKFLSYNTKCYLAHPDDFFQLIQDAAGVEEENQSCEALVRRKRKVGDSANDQSFHQKLFDPISGTFIRSRFSRSESPFSYVVSGGLSFIVNEEKRIERMIVYHHH